MPHPAVLIRVQLEQPRAQQVILTGFHACSCRQHLPQSPLLPRMLQGMSPCPTLRLGGQLLQLRLQGRARKLPVRLRLVRRFPSAGAVVLLDICKPSIVCSI